jgi:DNA-binding ferritin-like protein
MSEQSASALSRLVALLRAVQLLHHTAHWQTAGATFYGDHLMFERLYSGMTEEYDGLAEKAVYLAGVAVVDAVVQVQLIADFVDNFVEADRVSRALAAEMMLQEEIEECRATLGEAGELPIGLDNFLQGIADSHETACYLLKQRLS